MENLVYNLSLQFWAVWKICGGAILEVFGTELFDVYCLNYIHVVVNVIVSLCKFFATFTGII